MKTLRELLGFCNHKWIEIGRTKYQWNTSTGIEIRSGTLIIQKCEKCGKLKNFQVRL